MTVAELIKALRKMPPGALVAWQDHDNEDEINGFVRTVSETDSPALVARGVGVVLGA